MENHLATWQSPKGSERVPGEHNDNDNDIKMENDIKEDTKNEYLTCKLDRDVENQT